MKAFPLDAAILDRLPVLKKSNVKSRLAQIYAENGIVHLSIFGSALREDFSDESDIDLLVEFESGNRIGLIGLAKIELEIAKLLGRDVDLPTTAELSRYFRNQVKESAREFYTA
ncbi:MAG: nucleotidyltransferase domain-containing protein [Caldilineaceae bacterium]|nr:nucleotidyltransferase domain-containing protein [Caldilineaceae bacterium]